MKEEQIKKMIEHQVRIPYRYMVYLPYLTEEEKLSEDGTVHNRYIKDSRLIQNKGVELSKLLKDILKYFGLYYLDLSGDILMTREQAEKLLEAKEEILNDKD